MACICIALLLVPPKRFTHPVTKCFFLVSGTAVISAPIVLGAVGFTSAGIAAAAPVASGGVAAGSAVAVLHSADLSLGTLGSAPGYKILLYNNFTAHPQFVTIQLMGLS
uniref:Uncharacterized protein n=1 Tax=Haplochromis burtoni TaxID=8153 RepID=A0A3Q2VZA1_HAPBU